jgi:membrane peptidoglycan carboxypeptidase
MSAPPRRTGSAALGILGIAVVAGLMLTVGVAPAIALTASAKGTTGLFAALPDDLKFTNLQQKTEIYAKSGGKNVLLASFYNQNRDVIKWPDVPATVKNATLGAEDPRFYDHGGVDPMGIVSALVNNVLHHSSRGASTISQQYVKNVCIQEAELLPTAAKVAAAYAECTGGVQRKLREARYAIGLEKSSKKNEILLGYLNIAGFGGRIYGIESAAHYYYDTATKDLTVAQAASLMAIVNNPNYLRIDEKANIPANTARRNYVLGVELKYKMITRAEYDAAVRTVVKPKITPTTTGCAGAGSAAYFCDYVTNVVKNDRTFGATPAERYNRLQTGGLKIYTTLNMSLQKKASTAMKAYVPSKSPTGTDIGGAAVSVEAGTGRIISMVQSKRYDDSGGKGTTGAGYTATAVNYNTDRAYGGSIGFQPGSTYKTFTLIDWLEAGHGLNEVVNGSPRTEPTGTYKCASPDGPWAVGNDTANEGGYQTVMSATANSVNGAYADMAQKLSLCALKKTADDLGVHRADGAPIETNPSSILGTNLIAPLTMASAYSAIATKGTVCAPVAIDRITSTAGPVVVPKADCHAALPSPIAVATGYALHGVLTGGTAAADRGATGSAWGFAKTGTTDEAKSTWVVGGTTKAVTAVWVGNVRGSTNLRYVPGYSSCGKASDARHCLWTDIVAANTAKYGGDSSWPQPDTTYLYGQKVQVPDVAGKTVADAKLVLKAAGFQAKTGASSASDSVPAGAVISTDPPAGSSVVAGAVITLTKSTGPAPVVAPTALPGATVPIPNVAITMTLKDALGTLSAAGFTNVQLQSTPTGANTCRVLAQNPGGGTPSDPAAPVTLNVDGDPAACQQ